MVKVQILQDSQDSLASSQYDDFVQDPTLGDLYFKSVSILSSCEFVWFFQSFWLVLKDQKMHNSNWKRHGFYSLFELSNILWLIFHKMWNMNTNL